MGVRGEVFSNKIILPNRTYFFNVKENRMGDLFLNIVESKNRDNGGFERQSVILFAEDLQAFLKGFDESLKALEKAVREKRRGDSGKSKSPGAASSDDEPRGRRFPAGDSENRKPRARKFDDNESGRGKSGFGKNKSEFGSRTRKDADSPGRTFDRERPGRGVSRRNSDSDNSRSNRRYPDSDETRPSNRRSQSRPSDDNPRRYDKPGRKPDSGSFGRGSSDRSRSDRPRSDYPRTDRPRSDRSGSDRPRSDRPRSDRSGSDRPRSDRSRSERGQGSKRVVVRRKPDR